MAEKRIMAEGFISLMTSPIGRWMRVILGLVMMVWGLGVDTTTGYVIAALGLLPFLAGALDLCLTGPLFGGYLDGDKMRAALHSQQGHPELGSKPLSWLWA